MSRRRFQFSLRLLLAVVLCIAVVFGGLIATRDAVINRSNYNKLRLGMTESAVDALLPGTSVDLAPLNFEDVTFVESAQALQEEYPPPHKLRSWKGDKYLISTVFDRHGRLAAKYYQRAPDASMIDHFADWLGI